MNDLSEVRKDLVPWTWSFSLPQEPTVKLLPASQFSWEQLVDAYNQTRIDYIVPMPMNTARLREYVRDYDVDLDASVVAVVDDQIIGLAMLGVRSRRTWITRLGVLPTNRRRGAGQILMEHLIEASSRHGAECIILEVIKGNEPARQLFEKLGFRQTRELLVLRRPPAALPVPADSPAVETLNYCQTVELLHHRQGDPSWLDETRSLENAGNLAGLRIEIQNGGRGWIVYQNTIYQLRHLVLETEVGDSYQVGQALLQSLHTRHRAHDTNTENVPVDDPHLPAFWGMHYLEAFRRIEMRLDL
jgi:ribosomal protein S18 acetylase RimI-like enzyme